MDVSVLDLLDLQGSGGRQLVMPVMPSFILWLRTRSLNWHGIFGLWFHGRKRRTPPSTWTVCSLKRELDHFSLPRHMEGLPRNTQARKFEDLVQWAIGVQQDTQATYCTWFHVFCHKNKHLFVGKAISPRHKRRQNALFNKAARLVGIDWKLYGYLKDAPTHL